MSPTRMPPHGGRNHPTRPKPVKPRPASPPNAAAARGAVAGGVGATLVQMILAQSMSPEVVSPGFTVGMMVAVAFLNGLGTAVRNARERHEKGTPARFLLDLLSGLG